MTANWRRAAKSWCLNFGDVPRVPTALDFCWERRLRAFVMCNDFTCDRDKIGTNSDGRHTFLSDVSLKSWLESDRAGIAYWYCYLFPFITRYSTEDCLKIIASPSPSIKEATDWLRARMQGTTATRNVKEYRADKENTEQGSHPAEGHPAEGDDELKLAIQHFLDKGEIKVTATKAGQCKLVPGTTQNERLKKWDDLCATNKKLVIKTTAGATTHYIIQVPRLKKVESPPLRDNTQCEERVHPLRIVEAETLCKHINSHVNNSEKKKKKKILVTERYLKELKSCVRAETKRTVHKTIFQYSTKLQCPGGRRFSRGRTMQGILKSVRGVLCKGSPKKDKDIQKCNHALFAGMLAQITKDVQYPKLLEFTFLNDFLKKPEKYVKVALEHFGCTDDQAKELFLMRLNGGMPASWARLHSLRAGASTPDLLIKLFKDFDKGRDLIVQSRPDVLEAALLAGKERPELSAFSRIICEEEDKALQVIEDTAANLSIRVECLCFDGLVLDFTDIANADTIDKQFHTDVEENLERRLGYKIRVVEKHWVVEPVADNGEGDEGGSDDGSDEGDLDDLLPDALPGQHQCIPMALRRLGLPIRPEDFPTGPYTYRHVLSKVPGLSLSVVDNLESGCCYLFHQKKSTMDHCTPKSVYQDEVYDIHLVRPIKVTTFLENVGAEDVIFKVEYDVPDNRNGSEPQFDLKAGVTDSPRFTNDKRRAAINALQCAVGTRRPAPSPMPSNSCVSHTYLNLGVPVPVIPRRLSILHEGNALLQAHGLCNLPVHPEAISAPGRFIVAESGHCYALVMVDGFGVKLHGNCAAEVLDRNTLRDMISNNDICLYQLSPVESSIFMRGGWMPPWLHSRDMVCGARKRISVLARPAAAAASPRRRRFTTPAQMCECGCQLTTQSNSVIVAKLYTSEGVESVEHIRKKCRNGRIE